MDHLDSNGIQSSPVWALNHLQKPYRNCQSYKIEKAEKLVEQSLCVPSGVGIGVEEIQKVIQVVKKVGNDKLILLHCISDYPASPESLNLEMIPYLSNLFNVPIGFSDHSIGPGFGVAYGEKLHTLRMCGGWSRGHYPYHRASYARTFDYCRVFGTTCR